MESGGWDEREGSKWGTQKGSSFYLSQKMMCDERVNSVPHSFLFCLSSSPHFSCLTCNLPNCPLPSISSHFLPSSNFFLLSELLTWFSHSHFFLYCKFAGANLGSPAWICHYYFPFTLLCFQPHQATPPQATPSALQCDLALSSRSGLSSPGLLLT